MSIKSAFDRVSKSQSFCPKGTDPFSVSDWENRWCCLKKAEGDNEIVHAERGCFRGRSSALHIQSKTGINGSEERVLILIQQKEYGTTPLYCPDQPWHKAFTVWVTKEVSQPFQTGSFSPRFIYFFFQVVYFSLFPGCDFFYNPIPQAEQHSSAWKSRMPWYLQPPRVLFAHHVLQKVCSPQPLSGSGSLLPHSCCKGKVKNTRISSSTTFSF